MQTNMRILHIRYSVTRYPKPWETYFSSPRGADHSEKDHSLEIHDMRNELSMLYLGSSESISDLVGFCRTVVSMDASVDAFPRRKNNWYKLKVSDCSWSTRRSFGRWSNWTDDSTLPIKSCGPSVNSSPMTSPISTCTLKLFITGSLFLDLPLLWLLFVFYLEWTLDWRVSIGNGRIQKADYYSLTPPYPPLFTLGFLNHPQRRCFYQDWRNRKKSRCFLHSVEGQCQNQNSTPSHHERTISRQIYHYITRS